MKVKNKFLVHIHIFYKNQARMLACRASVVKKYGNYDVFITGPDLDENLRVNVKKYFPNAKFIQTKNVGADVWPFVHVLNNINLDDYKYIVKIHSKRNLKQQFHSLLGFSLTGSRFRKCALSFLRPKHFKKSVKTLNKKNHVNTICDYRLVMDNEICPMFDNETLKLTEEFMSKKMGISRQKYKAQFAMGTMFLSRAKLFKPIQKLELDESDFHEFISHTSCTLPHIMEHIFGFITTIDGGNIRDPFTNKITKAFHKMAEDPIRIKTRGLKKISIEIFPFIRSILHIQILTFRLCIGGPTNE